MSNANNMEKDKTKNKEPVKSNFCNQRNTEHQVFENAKKKRQTLDNFCSVDLVVDAFLTKQSQTRCRRFGRRWQSGSQRQCTSPDSKKTKKKKKKDKIKTHQINEDKLSDSNCRTAPQELNDAEMTNGHETCD
jgi:hypothetical protein